MFINEKGYDFISKENTLWLRGILALLVFVSHLPNYLGFFVGSKLGSVLQSFGSWCVAIFFFLSGYGLYTSYMVRGKEYVQALPRKRILPLYVRSLILLVCYICLLLFLGNGFNFWLLIRSLTFTGTYIANGWYLQVLLLLYLFFYAIFSINVSEKKKMIILFAITCVYYVVFYIHSLFYANSYFGISSIFCFVWGVLYAYKKYAIDLYLNRSRLAVAICGLVVFGIGGIVLITRKAIMIPTVLFGIQSTFITMSFAIGVLLLVRIFNFNCKEMRLLGKYSFEIYVLQGMGFILASSSLCAGFNMYIQVCISILITVALCYPFHLIFNRVDKVIT